MTRVGVYPVTEALVLQLATTFGRTSAAYGAVQEYEARRAAGEYVGYFLVQDSHLIIVGLRE